MQFDCHPEQALFAQRRIRASRFGACPERATATEWVCTICSSHVIYRPDQLDFFAAYVIPTDTWYILPIRATHHQPTIVLSPHLKKSKYAPYEEAWHLLTH